MAAVPSTPPLVPDCEALRSALLIEPSTLLMDSNNFAAPRRPRRVLLSIILRPFGLHKQGGKECAAYFGAKMLENNGKRSTVR